MTRVVLLTDTHFGARNDSLAFSAYFARFFDEVFFPYIDAHRIRHMVHLGDLVDRQKYINFKSANIMTEKLIKPLWERGIETKWIVGNHDTTYKTTNELNAITELYSRSKMFENSEVIVDKPREVVIADTPILMVPWICDSNYDESLKAIAHSESYYCMGHLELQGFEMNRGYMKDHGLGRQTFSHFKKVMSGHYHHKSSSGNVNYLGTPYEITWMDFADPKGFHIFDTETGELEFIDNPFVMFHKLVYDDTSFNVETLKNTDFAQYSGTYVKLLVKNKTNPYFYDLFFTGLEDAGADVTPVEDNLSMADVADDTIVSAAEDTPTIIRKTVEASTCKEPGLLNEYLQGLYVEATNLSDSLY